MGTTMFRFSSGDIRSDDIRELLTLLPSDHNGPVWFNGVKLTVPMSELRSLAAKNRTTLKTTPPRIWTARIDVTPRPALKTTHDGRFSPKAKDYHRYKDEILRQCKFWGYDPKWVVTAIDCTFLMPMPGDCWKGGLLTSKGFDLMGQPHELIPDWDNLIKPPQDALRRKDQTIGVGQGRKVWSPIEAGAILIRLEYR
jgi:hypothetical protein